jgi:hypothetical protein
MGAGKLPAFTFLHSVGAENGSSDGTPGRFGLATSWASRTYALSESASNTDGLMDAGCLPVQVAVARMLLGWFTVIPSNAKSIEIDVARS